MQDPLSMDIPHPGGAGSPFPWIFHTLGVQDPLFHGYSTPWGCRIPSPWIFHALGVQFAGLFSHPEIPGGIRILGAGSGKRRCPGCARGRNQRRERGGKRKGNSWGRDRELGERSSGGIRSRWILRIPQLPAPSARMFHPQGCRRSFPREPAPWWDGPWPCPPDGPQAAWDKPPWDEPPWDKPPRDGPPRDEPPWDKPPWDKPPRDGPPRDGPPWHEPPRDGPPWHEPPWDEPPWDKPPWDKPPRDKPPRDGPPRDGPPRDGPPRDGPPRDGPPWHEPPRDGPPRDEPPWDEPPWNGPPWEQQPRGRRCRRGLPSPRAFPGPGDVHWNEEEQDRRWAPPECPLPPPWRDRAAVPGAEGAFGECWYQDLPPDPWPEYPKEERCQPCPPSGPAGNPGNFHQHRPPWSHHPAGTRRSRPRQLLVVPRAWCPRPSRGHKPRSKPSCPAPSRRSQPGATKEPQPPEPPQRPEPPPGAAERQEQPQDVPAGTGDVLEPPSPARSPLESPAADPGADPGAAELQVELAAGQSPVGSQGQDPCAPGADPAPPEETSRNPEIQEHREVEPCSVPKAGSGHGSPPRSPAAPADPARREILGCSCCGAAELSPPSCAAGETEARAAQAGAVCGQQQLSSEPPSPFPAGIDSRSAAVLRRKAKIELSYQQFSLSVAVVATMLLHQEPSMEAALGVALRANLRQGRLHHLQQLEEFIDSLDSVGSSSL
ncbi:uncharacterized protein LOC106630211 isoform X3 [Zonotrichia albicollis]|uniref:uncharacterized protein LOC106630211 isoform X3 n=1 Tax=Zonotrichia albicollis TaxID=44394 RepID=UPI003D80D00E